MLLTPPVLANQCAGDESVVNPSSCSSTGNETSHEVQLIAVDGDCNSGFDLDSCPGESCRIGGLAPGEGVDGVDNALAGLAPVLVNVGANLGGIDQVLYQGLCDGSISWTFRIEPNVAESCVNVTPIYGGVIADTIPMNLSGTGCISGALGSVPIPIAGVQGRLDNALIRGTADVTQGLNVTLGATAEEETAKAIAEALIDGGSAVVAQVLDINSSLQGDVNSSCDALSLSLDVGATTIGNCVDASNAQVYENLDYIDDFGQMYTGTEAAVAIGQDCLFGSNTSDPTLAGCPSEAARVLSCFPNCPTGVVDELSSCVTQCSQDAIAEASPPGLSDSCAACLGDKVACDASLCTNLCVADVSSPACIQCRCENDCTPRFETCSGFRTGVCN
ncbi:MAG: hypothetical protein EX268_12205 [Deltaproteobacteria bacterium]|nr:MAG: hypothetical protein EX268_12205 [Deltaproteobacteria bacterium]